MANTGGTSWSDLSRLGKFSIGMQASGALSGVIGSFFSAGAEKYKYKTMALQLQHKKDMALFNKDMKESQAQHINMVFNKRMQMLSLQQAAAKGRGRVSMAARGGQRGVGSNKDVMLSNDIMMEIDKHTMNANKVKAVNDKRLEGVGLGIQAHMYGVGANNMFSTASSISPWMNMTSSLLTGTSNVISSLPSSMFIKKT
tara:strand:+ start:2801 stop:3397 length:597 start_codon:yes stop_codon:yes gene_type:complete